MRNSIHRQCWEHIQGYTARRYRVQIQAAEMGWATASPSPGTLCFSPQGSCSFPTFSLINMEQARRMLFKTQLPAVEAPSIPHFVLAAPGFLESRAACRRALNSVSQEAAGFDSEVSWLCRESTLLFSWRDLPLAHLQPASSAAAALLIFSAAGYFQRILCIWDDPLWASPSIMPLLFNVLRKNSTAV